MKWCQNDTKAVLKGLHWPNLGQYKSKKNNGTSSFKHIEFYMYKYMYGYVYVCVC